MRRFLIFALLGPLIPYLVLTLVVFGITGSPKNKFWFLIILYSYLIGLLPALIAWGANMLAARKPFLLRLAVTSVAGMAGTMAWMAVAFMSRSDPVGPLLAFGAIGGAVAAICSVLAHLIDRKRNASAGAAADTA